MGKGKKRAVILAVAAAVILAVGIGGYFLFAKILPYRAACTAFEQGNYQEAIDKFSALGSFRDSARKLDGCYYEMGKEYLAAHSFSEAKEALERAGDHEDAAALLTRCDYEMAIEDYHKKQYDRAINALEALGNYEDAQEYLDMAKMDRKYADFDPQGADPQEVECAVDNAQQVEALMAAELYGTWYGDGGDTVVVNADTINGKEYCVKAFHWYDSDCYSALVYDPADPANAFFISCQEQMFYPENFTVFYMTRSRDGADLFFGRDVTPERYEEMCEENARWEEEQLRKSQTYTDAQVIQFTADQLQNRLEANLGAMRIFAGLEVDSANVEYDWQSRTYTCYLSAYFQTRLGLDRATIHYAQARYYDTGTELKMTYFDYD